MKWEVNRRYSYENMEDVNISICIGQKDIDYVTDSFCFLLFNTLIAQYRDMELFTYFFR
jgi:hypothetical protein